MEKTDAHVFIDELLIDDVTPEVMLSKWNKKDRYLWIVLHRTMHDVTIFEKLGDVSSFENFGFSVVHLQFCLRNTKQVIDVAKREDFSLYPSQDNVRRHVEHPDNIPSGNEPRLVFETNEALKLAKEYGWLSTDLMFDGRGILYYVNESQLYPLKKMVRRLLPRISGINGNPR